MFSEEIFQLLLGEASKGIVLFGWRKLAQQNFDPDTFLSERTRQEKGKSKAQEMRKLRSCLARVTQNCLRGAILFLPSIQALFSSDENKNLGKHIRLSSVWV